MNAQVKNYNKVAIFLHWISAIVIIGMFVLGVWMVGLNYYSSWYKEAPHLHKSIGLLLAAMTLLRVIWKAKTSSPKIEGKRYEVVAATAIHHLIYLDLVLIFVSGYLISTADGRGIEVFNWFTVPGTGELFLGQSDLAGLVHSFAAWGLISMAALHALAAIKHHVINKDNTLRKMIGVNK